MYQKVVIAGNLGADPEMRYLPSGDAVTNFSVAVNRRIKDQDVTTWFRVAAWRRTAEVANQYLRKGSAVIVEGELRPDPDTGAPRIFTRGDGTPGTSYELDAHAVRFISGGTAPDEIPQPSKGDEKDEIPF